VLQRVPEKNYIIGSSDFVEALFINADSKFVFNFSGNEGIDSLGMVTKFAEILEEKPSAAPHVQKRLLLREFAPSYNVQV
jgi:hypothetical protein